jgi:hypothetical protein
LFAGERFGFLNRLGSGFLATGSILGLAEVIVRIKNIDSRTSKFLDEILLHTLTCPIDVSPLRRVAELSNGPARQKSETLLTRRPSTRLKGSITPFFIGKK